MAAEKAQRAERSRESIKVSLHDQVEAKQVCVAVDKTLK